MNNVSSTHGTYYLTPEGLKKIRQEFERLSEFKKTKTSGEVPSTWESEEVNPEYLAFQEDISILEARLAEYEIILKNVEIIAPPVGEKRFEVHLGARITVEVDNGEVDEFEIVGTLEANPSLGRISNESPVGAALMNSKIGDEVAVSSPKQTIYKIKKIAYAV
ncbi:MAG: GreA/GreB family elongation factor [bacterium]|nr:GreA/GreB family elongation factor [bacterium]